MENRVIKNKYKILKKLGQGSFGSAFKALNNQDQKIVVIKEIELTENKEENAQIENEGNILSKINSENVVKFYESFIENSFYYLVMEYCDSDSLTHFIEDYRNKNKLIPELTILDIFCQICLGLKEIHSHNIIHRDLKPDNVFLSENLRVKIGDFGVSKETESNKKYAQTLIGTLIYMSPEIIQAQKYTNKTDIWSMGCILYELCTLNYIFPADNQYVFVNSVIKSKPKKIDSRYYGPELQSLIDSLLEKNPDKRPNIESVIEEVQKLLKIYGDSEYKVEEVLEILLESNKEGSNVNIEDTVGKTIELQSEIEVKKDPKPIRALKMIGAGALNTAASIRVPGFGFLRGVGMGSGLSILSKITTNRKKKFIDENFDIVIRIQKSLLEDIKKEIDFKKINNEVVITLSDVKYNEKIKELMEKLKEEKYKNNLKIKLENMKEEKDGKLGLGGNKIQIKKPKFEDFKENIIIILIKAMYMLAFTKKGIQELGKTSAENIQNFLGTVISIINDSDPRLNEEKKENNQKSILLIYNEFDKATKKLNEDLKNKLSKKNLESSNKDFLVTYYNNKPADYKKQLGFERFKLKVYFKIYDKIESNRQDIINNLFNKCFSSSIMEAVKKGLKMQLLSKGDHILNEIYDIVFKN